MATSLVPLRLLDKMSLLKLLPRHVSSTTSTISSSIRTVSNDHDQDELFRKIIIEVKGHNPQVINSYQKFTVMAAHELGVNIERIFEPPRVMTRMSLMKSVFVHKKHFHQYEMRTLYRVFELKHLTGSTASTFLEYIQRNLPEGVAMKVTKHQLERLPEHLQPPASLGDGKGEERPGLDKSSDADASNSDFTADEKQTSASLLSSSVDPSPSPSILHTRSSGVDGPLAS